MSFFSAEIPIGTEQDALDLVALCSEHSTNLLLLHSEVLSDEFFRLRTGAAGEILQKLTNYHIKAAAVVPAERVSTGKFKDMAIEANRGNQFRIFNNKDQAEEWLLAV